MKARPMLRVTAALAVLCLPALTGAHAQDSSATMSFFVTSVGTGKGAALGGLEGADRHCQTLAQAAGAGNKTWRAYLSTQASGSTPAVNARDRIGRGPWQNAKGAVIAKDVADLHGSNNLTKQTALTERGDIVKGRGDTPNTHDIITGSQPDGTAFAGSEDMTCGNYTKSGTEGAVMFREQRVERDRLRRQQAAGQCQVAFGRLSDPLLQCRHWLHKSNSLAAPE